MDTGKREHILLQALIWLSPSDSWIPIAHRYILIIGVHILLKKIFMYFQKHMFAKTTGSGWEYETLHKPIDFWN